jgi:hypothetical protein
MHLRQIFCATMVRAALTAALVAATGCGHSAQSVAPSALVANPSNYDGQDVSVAGTVKDPMTRQMRRGPASIYQLCDTACINVVQFGGSNVVAGAQQTVTGRFRTAFGRARAMSNVLVVGGRRQE